MVCRSESPTGGFVDQNGVDCAAGGGTPVLESNGDVYAPGGQGVIYDKGQGAVVMYYHYGELEVFLTIMLGSRGRGRSRGEGCDGF